MHDLTTIIKMNQLAEAAKSIALAKLTNNPVGHPKDAEKGRAPKHECEACENLRIVARFWRNRNGITTFRTFCNGCRRGLSGRGWKKLG